MKDLDAGPKSVATTPGVVLGIAATLAFIVSVLAFSLQHSGIGVGAASIALLSTGAALSSLSAEARRLRDAQPIAR
jgi:hypothetical protein